MPWNGRELGGSFALGPWRVRRAGYGAMQLAGDGVFGPPRDRDEALRVLRAAAAAGVDHIDTAQYYGAGTVNELIREALHPYPDGLAIVSKVGAPDARGAVLRPGEADELRHGIEDNLVTLGATRLAAVNLRVMDPAEPPGSRFDAQLAALVRAREEGLIGGVGLSNISRGHLVRAVAQTEIVCVQNLFNVADQRSRDVLTECEARGIAFVPFCPLGMPGAARRRLLTDPALAEVAARLGATPVQVALAWLLDLAPNILLIPGTRTRAHLAENLSAASVRLDDAARADLARRFPTARSARIQSGSLRAQVVATEDGQQPGQIVGILSHGAFGADHADEAGHRGELPGRLQRVAHQACVQHGGLARGLRQILRVNQELHGARFQEFPQGHQACW